MRLAGIHFGLFIVLLISSIQNPLFAQNAGIVDSLNIALAKSKEPEAKITTLLALSLETEGSQPERSLTYAQQALQLSEKSGMDIWIIRSKIRIGACYLALNDFNSALKFTEEAKELAEKVENKRETAIALGNLAIIYGAIGDYVKSSELDFKSLKLFEEIGDKNQIGVALGNIGVDFMTQGNYEKGLEYLFKSLAIASEINDMPGLAYQYNNIAGVYFENYKDYKKALEYYFRALTANRKTGNTYQEATNLLNIGMTYFEMHELDSSYFYAQQALKIFTVFNSTLKLAGCQMLLADYYSTIGNFDQARSFALSALNIGQAENSLETIKRSAAILKDIYLKKGDYENAFAYIKTEFEARDSLYSQQSQKELLKLEIQYNQDKLERARQIKQQRRNFLTGLVFVILMSLIINAILIISRQKIKVKNTLLEKESVEKELDFKSKELSINVMALMKKNEMLADISKRLVQIEKIAISEETKNAISNIYKELRKSTDDKIINEFSVRFQQVHAGFYEALLSKYPELTQNDLKLCAYLRLNMSTKDISELTGISKLTIENARYRLRKKLGITNSETNLVTFLLQI
jgi:tetratricopeptide (TPR) repeat protein